MYYIVSCDHVKILQYACGIVYTIYISSNFTEHRSVRIIYILYGYTRKTSPLAYITHT